MCAGSFLLMLKIIVLKDFLWLVSLKNEDVILARLVGHVFGDGHIHIHKYYFVYVNSEGALLERVKKYIEKVFGCVKVNLGSSIGGVPRLQFSNIVGKHLSFLGAPVGSKIRSPTSIPKWIETGSEEVIIAFLSSLVDDEFSLRKYDATIKVEKLASLINELKYYLLSLKKLFKEIGIEVSEPHSDQEKMKANGEKVISMRIWITGRHNLRKLKKLDIVHPRKKEIIISY